MSRWAALSFALLASLLLGSAPATARADAPASGAARAVDLENTICPVTGKPVVPGITATVNGAVVHFCCTMCIEKYRANPAAYEPALRKDAEVGRRLDAVASPPPSSGPSPAPDAGPGTSPELDKSQALHDTMRGLWDDHVTWTRLFLVSAVADLPDADAAKNRLLRNQDDIADAIRTYYGDEAGKKLSGLLKAHITLAAELVGALKGKDAAKADAAKAKWASNGEDIAAFLSGANAASWPIEATSRMMRDHLNLTADEVAARIKGDWDADQAAFDKVRAQARVMADMLSDGIRHQFPEKFR